MAGQPAGRLYVEILADIAELQKDLDTAKRSVRKAANDMGDSAKHANDNIAGMGKAMGGVSTTSRAMRANMINLGRQVQDVGTMFALGAPPMQIFASQGAQVFDVLTMMNAEAKATNTSLLRMAGGGLVKAGPAIGVAAVAAGTLAAGLHTVTNAINENSEVTVTWSDVALGAMDMLADRAQNALVSAFEAMGIDIGAVWEWIGDAAYTSANRVVGFQLAARDKILAAFQTFPAAFAEYFVDASNSGLQALEDLVNGGIELINEFSRGVNDLLGSDIGMIGRVDFGEIENSYRGAGERAAKAWAAGSEQYFKDHLGEFADALSPYAQDRAIKRMEKDAEKAGKKAGRKAGRAAAEELSKSFQDALERNAFLTNSTIDRMIDQWGENFKRQQEQEQSVHDLRRAHEQLIRELEIELNLLDATEQQRATAALMMEREAFLAARAALGINEATKQWEEYYKARKAVIDGQAGLQAENEEIDRLVGNLARLGGLFGQDIGGLIDGVLGMEVRFADGEVRSISEEIAKTFPEMGDIIAQAVSGAVLGSLASSAILGGGGAGGAIGGALGNIAGTKFLGGALGSFAGPLGSIAGGLVGGLIGGLLKGTPRASATIEGIGGEAVQSAVRGNKSKLRDAAGSLADSLIGSLTGITDALGGEIGSFGGISIGVRKDTFRVDPTGQGRTKNQPSFETEQEAIAYALQLAIERGAITGLSAAEETLLRAGGDLSAQLDKVLTFQSVFDRLAEATDPEQFKLDQLEEEFAGLRAIFDEAGASAAQYADLEKLYQIERGKVLEEFQRDLSEQRRLEAQILELQGDSVGALALLRQVELDETEEGLRHLKERIFVLEDEAAAAERITRQTEESVERRRGLMIRLLEAEGNLAAAEAMRREDELKAYDRAEQGVLRKIYALEDEKAALDEAAAAQERYSQALSAAKDALRQAIDAERSAINERLSPLQNEFDRLSDALFPEQSLTDALEARDVMSEMLAIAERLASASRNVLRDNERVSALQAAAARRELFRAAETGRFRTDRIEQLIPSATNFAGQFGDPVEQLRQQAITANNLAELAEQQRRRASNAQAAEDLRAKEAREAALERYNQLATQIATEQAQLANLDRIAGEFGLLNQNTLSIVDAVNNLQGVLRDGLSAAAAAGAASAASALSPNSGPASTSFAQGGQGSSAAAMNEMRKQNAQLAEQNGYLKQITKNSGKQLSETRRAAGVAA